MLNVVATNTNRGQRNLKFFEIGNVFVEKQEQECLGIVLSAEGDFDWREQQRQLDFFDLKGILIQTFSREGIDKLKFEAADKEIFEQGFGATVFFNSKEVGAVGRVREAVLRGFHIKEKNIYYAQIFPDFLYSRAGKGRNYKSVSDYPAVVRDVSLAVDQKIQYQQVYDIIEKQGKSILSDVRFVEQYLGEKIPSGQKGLVFSMTYQSPQRTLREEEVNQVHENVVQTIIRELGATQR